MYRHGIGNLIVSTKELLALEELLNILATMIPSMKRKGAEERMRRKNFIHQVFSMTKPLHPHCNELVQILETINSPDWEETSAKIIDILARDLAL